jgi:tetratricopeptide (TPR) repeat protein
MCQEIVQQQPDCVPALHLLGTIAHHTHRLDSAIAHYRQVLRLEPNHFEAHTNLGVALQQRGDLQAAERHLRRSLELNPNHVPTWFNLGNLLSQRRDLDGAIAAYQSALSLNPNHFGAHNNLGNASWQKGELDAAILHFQHTVRLEPQNPLTHNNLGNALQQQGQLELAMAHYRQALALQPESPGIYYNQGNAHRKLQQHEAAIACYQKSLELQPDQPLVLNNLALTYQDQQNYDQAVSYFQRAVTLKPDYVEAHSNLGVALQRVHDLKGAIVHCRKAIKLAPQFADAHYNLASALLTQGNFLEGFAEYEWRLTCWNSPQPSWDGSSLDGKTILLRAEQGFGDTIQFIRYLPLVAALEGEIVLEVQPELVRLFQNLPQVRHLVAQGNPLPSFDVHAPLLSLPHLLKTTARTIPASVPYLSLPPEPFQLPHPAAPRLKVGIAWASGYQSNSEPLRLYKMRSCPLSLFLKLRSVPNVELYSLQVGQDGADLYLQNQESQIHNLSRQLQDFADTAAAIAQLDLVISVDTAVAHLAGAMGKPTWVLLAFSPDWRWMLNRSDSPWYPTLRLFRQEQPGDWHGVMAKVVQALGQFTAINPPRWGKSTFFR